jgi:hypothetical protein
MGRTTRSSLKGKGGGEEEEDSTFDYNVSGGGKGIGAEGGDGELLPAAFELLWSSRPR